MDVTMIVLFTIWFILREENRRAITDQSPNYECE